MLNFIPKKLSAEELKVMRKEFERIEVDPEQAEIIWKQMNDFFVALPAEQDAEFYKDYFSWYTELSWRFLQTRDYDFVVNVAMGRQIPMAILLGYDVWGAVMSYLAFEAELVPDMQSLYGKMKASLINSGAVIGTWQGQNYTMQNLVQEVERLNALEDSMQEADFRTKIFQIYISSHGKSFEDIIIADPSKAVNKIIGIINFFLGVEPEKIWYIVDLYTHPEFESSSTEVVEAPSVEESASTEVPAVPDNFTEQPPTPQEIKSQIEQQFKKDTEGNFEDIDGVMRKLEEFTEMYDDPKIADLLYFDEEENRFKWKI